MNGKRKMVKPGNDYGKIRVLSVVESNKKPKRYNCQCLSCGSNIVYTGQEVFKYQDLGCIKCRKDLSDEKRIESARAMIGETFGELTIQKISGLRKYNGRNTVFAECKCKCGSVSEIPLNRLRAGKAKKCKWCNTKNLEAGRKIVSESSVGGTLVVAIDGRRKRNKNSSTGVNGVSYHKQMGKYRAYINFKRKQYSLGLYEKIEDAVKARKAAEKEIYENFLEWYASKYPKEWERIKRGDN